MKINVKLSQEEDIKYLGLHLDSRLTWHKWKQLGITVTKMYWFLARKSKLSTSNKHLVYTRKKYSNQSGLAEYNSGDGFQFQHRNYRTLPIESLAHDSGCTMVHAKYGHPKGSPNINR
jgi:hypothetical protein